MSTLLLSEVVEEKEKPHFLSSAYLVNPGPTNRNSVFPFLFLSFILYPVMLSNLFIAEKVIEVDQLKEKNNGAHLGRPTRRHK